MPQAQSQTVVEDIRDIEGPVPLPGTLVPLWIAFAVFAGLLLIFLWKRRKRKVVVPEKSAEALALERLEQVRSLLGEQTAREFVDSVSEIVRSYIERRFELKATRETTEEFLSGLKEKSDSALLPYSNVLTKFLHYCDLAKFARSFPGIDQMEEMFNSAKDLVVQTSTKVTEDDAQNDEQKGRGEEL